MSAHEMQDPKSCILLVNPSTHAYKELKNDFHIQQLPFQRINLQEVNSELLHSWIKWRIEREED